MPAQPYTPIVVDSASSKQVVHILIAGLQSSDKIKLVRHISETPLEEIDIASQEIPTKLPHLMMGQVRVDARLTAHIWGAPDQWRHDYVNYLVNIQSISDKRSDFQRVLGMIVVIDSLPTVTSVEEGKLLRLIASDWNLPYIVLASHPYDAHARTLTELRDLHAIGEPIPLYPCDVSDRHEANRAFINFLYHAM